MTTHVILNWFTPQQQLTNWYKTQLIIIQIWHLEINLFEKRRNSVAPINLLHVVSYSNFAPLLDFWSPELWLRLLESSFALDVEILKVYRKWDKQIPCGPCGAGKLVSRFFMICLFSGSQRELFELLPDIFFEDSPQAATPFSSCSHPCFFFQNNPKKMQGWLMKAKNNFWAIFLSPSSAS